MPGEPHPRSPGIPFRFPFPVPSFPGPRPLASDLRFQFRVSRSTIVPMKRSGTADLPLHGGRVPRWLAERMTALGTAICENVLVEYGPSGLLARLSDPFWFQALGTVMGMDWHSS